MYVQPIYVNNNMHINIDKSTNLKMYDHHDHIKVLDILERFQL